MLVLLAAVVVWACAVVGRGVRARCEVATVSLATLDTAWPCLCSVSIPKVAPVLEIRSGC